MSEIQILTPRFRPSRLPLEFYVLVTCLPCGGGPRSIALTRREAEALAAGLVEALAGQAVRVTVEE